MTTAAYYYNATFRAAGLPTRSARVAARRPNEPERLVILGMVGLLSAAYPNMWL